MFNLRFLINTHYIVNGPIPSGLDARKAASPVRLFRVCSILEFEENNMKRIGVLVVVMLLAGGSYLAAQEADTSESAEEDVASITLDGSLGFPTQGALGVYWPINFMNLPNGILSGLELSFGYGTPLKGPIRFAKEDEEELTDYEYVTYPDPAPDTMGRGWSIRTYLTAYELGLGFATMPIKTGASFNLGKLFGPDDQEYLYFDAAFLVKAEAELEAFSLLKPYVELGIGAGSASANNDAAKQTISGLSSAPLDSTSDDYTKWSSGKFKYTNLTMNIGVRFELPLNFWAKTKEKLFYSGEKSETGEGAGGEASESEGKTEPEPVELVSDFKFPQWLMDRGGMSYFPDGRSNPMAGSITVGPQKFFKNYNFKHESSYKDNKFKYKYEPESIVEIVQSDEQVWHAIMQNEEGEEKEYKLHRLNKGEKVTIEGEEIDPKNDGVYYDGNVYYIISVDM